MTYSTKTAKLTAVKALLLSLSVIAGLFFLLFTVLAAVAEVVSKRAIEELHKEPMLLEDVLTIDPMSAAVEATATMLFDNKATIEDATENLTNHALNVTRFVSIKVSDVGYREALKLARSMGAKFSKQPKAAELQDWLDDQEDEVIEDEVYGTDGDLESGLEQAMAE